MPDYPEPYPPSGADDVTADTGTTPEELLAFLQGLTSGYSETAGEYTGDNTDGLHVKYQLVKGTRVMRPQGQGPGQRVRLHADYYQKVVWFSYERKGDWPLCPSPFVNDPNAELVRAEVTLASPLVVDAERIYRVSGLYVFEMLNGPNGTGVEAWGPFAIGTSPESLASLSQHTMPQNAFNPGALGPGYHKLL